MSPGPRVGSYSYARWEFERRYLVRSHPAAATGESGWDVNDRYLHDSRLRLRRMDPLGAGEPVFKLGKKEVLAPPDFARMTITTIYLSEAEYRQLAALPAFELHKRRYGVEEDGRSFGVDVFDGSLTGLVLAETDFETVEELELEIDLPAWVLRDVSTDERLTGGALAQLADEARASLVRELYS